MKQTRTILLFAYLLLTAGCATLPAGPSVMVLPPAGKPFEVFQQEDAICRQWAAQRIGISPQDAANQNVAAGAVVGTAAGAGLGALIGSASGQAGAGAAIGAASGLFFGTALGADAARVSGWQAQRQYDIAYQQCMYSYGNSIPGVVRQSQSGHSNYAPPPPPPPGYRAPGAAPAYP